ncbi:RNA helicase aquarius [Larimichthys crocea]|uniref:Uncharacterized protein n=1 Tax=Larimichthys crocea TaxID=215358 RepID=A0ACD3RSI1_LARCR|nr:RNA helicase aquarius [Larimichthys crocea]
MATMEKETPAKKAAAPSVSQINAEYVTQLANKYWAPHAKNKLPFDPKVMEDVYEKEILKSKFAIRKIMLLEFSQYLENYLWVNYTPEVSSNAYLMSICCIVNEKFRENVPAWEVFKKEPSHFPYFFKCVMEAVLAGDEAGLTLKEQTVLLVFLDHCFNSLEVDLIREQVQQLISLPMWMCLLPSRLQQELKKVPKLQKFWNLIKKKFDKMDADAAEQAKKERAFLSALIKKFLGVLTSIPPSGPVSMDKVHYCERFIELMIDLEALLPTRRWFNTVLDDSHLVVSCHLSSLVQREKEGHLFCQLLDMLKFYTGFEISDQTGNALTEKEMTTLHYDRITSLQRAAFAHFPELHDFALSSIAAVDTRESLTKHFGHLSPNTLHQVASYLCLLPELPEGQDTTYEKEVLLELLVSRHERRISQIEQLNQMPLYPTEKIIWDENIVPTEYYSGEGCLALPKLNLQFLTLHDYLLRNFNLFRLESTYEIRQDIEDVVWRMKPWQSEYGGVVFGGWARMAQTITSFSIVEVAKPNIGESWPARVRADVTVNLNVQDHIKHEWEGLRKHDVCFLITVRPNLPYGTRFDRRQPFVEQTGLVYVRGCEVQGMLDDKGRVIEEGPDPKPKLRGDARTFRVWLDPNQYQQDMTSSIQSGTEDPYETFNVIMRRKPKENNFKAVLETIRNLMNTECVVPDWLHDIILGYGDPGSAHYSKMPNQISTLDFNDTFLSLDHLRSCFPGYTIKVTEANPELQVFPFRIKFPISNKTDKGKKRKADEEEEDKEEDMTLIVEPYVTPNRGPYPYNQPKRNTIQFTPTQIEAIRAGMQPGLTMVVGPPGTGKTDVAVQIISNLYHNFPEAEDPHSDTLESGSEPAVRKDHGSRHRRAPPPASRPRRRGAGDREGLQQVISRWEEYMSKVRPKQGKKVEEFRAFELLRSGLDRSKYLLVKEAKIIAMTCTHAALKRHDLVELGFKYDNILMEEAAQILEIETFIPLLLQNPEDGYSRLKRWIMIGDHHQLPPVIKNMAFQKYSNMEQSLFTRFVRLGVPTIDLDAQGRARASLCNLYNWRYKHLGNLPHVQQLPEFQVPNPGLTFDFQLINVEDFNGVGESEPNPYFYQNLAEAEYAVALYMYMRLLGYPADRISILTTYNGQKHLIRDVINQRCAGNPFFSQPNKITTVDRFQGQQNDYIILSLVRTKAVGHLRDVRRLVVAMSRARLDLHRINGWLTRQINLHCHSFRTSYCDFDFQQRDASGQPDQIIKNMPEMANLVYNMYMHMMQTSQKYRQQQQEKLALPPQQAKTDALAEKAPASSGEPQEETPMEQETPEAEAKPEPNSEDTSEKKENEDTADHAKMPEHPGRDSDSDGEDSGGEKEQ